MGDSIDLSTQDLLDEPEKYAVRWDDTTAGIDTSGKPVQVVMTQQMELVDLMAMARKLTEGEEPRTDLELLDAFIRIKRPDLMVRAADLSEFEKKYRCDGPVGTVQ